VGWAQEQLVYLERRGRGVRPKSRNQSSVVWQGIVLELGQGSIWEWLTGEGGNALKGGDCMYFVHQK